MGSNNLPTPELLLFDWDNTLVDTASVITVAMRETLKKMQWRAFTEEEHRTAMNMSLRERFPLLFGERWEEARDIYYARYEAISKDNLKPLKGAESCLQQARGAVIPMGVISNKRGPTLRREINRIGWQDYFIGATGATDTDEDKPSRLMYRHFLEVANLSEPSQIWMIGDSEADMLFAHNIGAAAIFIGDTQVLDADIAALVDFACADVATLKKFL